MYDQVLSDRNVEAFRAAERIRWRAHLEGLEKCAQRLQELHDRSDDESLQDNLYVYAHDLRIAFRYQRDLA